MLRYLTIVFASLQLSSCYLEGGACSGPVCFYGATDICDGFGHCDDVATSDRCPDADDVQAVATQEINRIRSSPTRCGGINLPTTNPLIWSQELFQVADRHSLDMAGNNFIANIGSDGLGVSDRVGDSVTYARQSIAGGFVSTRALIEEWLQTDDCAVLVDQNATEFGLSCRYDSDSTYGQYWTLVTGDY